jgi:hypothetical protein
MRVSPDNSSRNSNKTKGAAVSLTPRERLREMLDRAGISSTQAALAAGYSDRSGLNKYLDKNQQGDKPIPWSCVKRLVDVLRGRGNPSITLDELVDISTNRGKAGNRLAQVITRSREVDDFRAVNAGTLLPVIARAESDVYVHSDKAQKSYGTSRISVSPEFPATSQGVVLVVDPSFERYSQGTQLHVVQMSEFPGLDLTGRHGVALVPASGGPLCEVTVVRFNSGVRDGECTASTHNGQRVEGADIRWVIVGSYRKE